MLTINNNQYEDLNYEDALKLVFDIRKQRQKVYGDSWKEVEAWEHLALIKEKIRRLEHNLNKVNIYENDIDCLIDLINFSLFMLDNKIQNNKIQNNKNEVDKQ